MAAVMMLPVVGVGAAADMLGVSPGGPKFAWFWTYVLEHFGQPRWAAASMRSRSANECCQMDGDPNG